MYYLLKCFLILLSFKNMFVEVFWATNSFNKSGMATPGLSLPTNQFLGLEVWELEEKTVLWGNFKTKPFWHVGIITIPIVFTEGRLCLGCHGRRRKQQNADFSSLLLFFVSCLQHGAWMGQSSISPDATSLHGASPTKTPWQVLRDEDFILVSWPASIWPQAFYLNISKAPISAALKCSIRYGLSLCSVSALPNSCCIPTEGEVISI